MNALPAEDDRDRALLVTVDGYEQLRSELETLSTTGLQTGDVAEYELVGAIESNVGNGRVSMSAPVGRALVDHGAGAVVEAETPRGTLALEILSVRAPNVRALAKEAA